MRRALDEFIDYPFPPVEYLLGKWLPKRGIVMLAGYRGVGKTFASLGIAGAVASGTALLEWEAPEARGVLIVDGEMDPADLQARLRALRVGLGAKGAVAGRNLRILTHADFEFGIPNLADVLKPGRSIVEEAAEDCDLIILDNKSTLCSSGDENSGADWQGMQEWLLHLRRRGKTVLLIHHGGKPDRETGRSKQRGTSRIEDPLNTSIMLHRPPGMGRDKFVWEWTKTRGWLPERDEFTVQIEGDWTSGRAPGGTLSLFDDAEGGDGAQQDQEAKDFAEFLHGEGYTLREIQARTKISKSTLGRILNGNSRGE